MFKTIFKPRKVPGRKPPKAQAFVEFAVIIPLLLLVLTGVIEFGYAFYTWAAVSEMARIGTRYAVTGQYDVQYCDDAGSALGLAADDLADGVPADCIVPNTVADFEDKTAALQDWARIPSVRDAALKGGSTGLLFNSASAVSGDYLTFLKNPATRDTSLANKGFSQAYRGDPTANGFISINICSTRILDPENPVASQVALDNGYSYYYNGLVGTDARYLGVCTAPDRANPTTVRKFMDDAGGPGDRIRLTVTYNHPLIVPFFAAMWPHLKLTTTQDAIVEKFRTSRLAGLSSGISELPTDTPVPATATDLPTATSTSTNTSTPTFTATPPACANPNGSGVLASYYAYRGDAVTDTWSNLIYSRTEAVVNNDWGSNSPVAGIVPVDNFRVRYTAKVYPPYPGDYYFVTLSDDGVRLLIDGTNVIDDWDDHGSTRDQSSIVNFPDCSPKSLQLEFYEKGGNALIKLGWINPNIGGEIWPVAQKYLVPPTGTLVPTSTFLTPTPSRTFTSTNTRTATYTRTFTRTATITNTRPTNTASLTYTRTATVPTSTFSPTVPTNTRTWTPTRSNTPIPPTATNTVKATMTFTPSKTKTPAPTCATPPDLGGCH